MRTLIISIDFFRSTRALDMATVRADLKVDKTLVLKQILTLDAA